MTHLKQIFIFLSSFLFLFIAGSLFAYAGGGGGNEAELTEKVSTEGLDGFNLWLVNLYNDSRLLLALVTVACMGIVGITIAYITEIILKMFGLQVSKIDHQE